MSDPVAGLPFRYSPSGPEMGNEEGAPYAPGPGMQLRLAETQGSGTTQVVQTTVDPVIEAGVAADPFEVSLTNPNKNLRYKINAMFDARSTGGGNHNIDVIPQVRYQVGGVFGPWLDFSANRWAVDNDTARTVHGNVAMTLGADLLHPVPDNCQVMSVRCAVSAGTAGLIALTNGGAAGTFYMSLAELG